MNPEIGMIIVAGSLFIAAEAREALFGHRTRTVRRPDAALHVGVRGRRQIVHLWAKGKIA